MEDAAAMVIEDAAATADVDETEDEEDTARDVDAAATLLTGATIGGWLDLEGGG